MIAQTVSFTTLLGTIAAGGAVVATSVNVIRDPLDKRHTWPNSLIDAIALGVGVAYCLGWRVDVSPQVFAMVPALTGRHLAGAAGQVLTGLLFGAAATFGAKFFNALGAWQRSNQANAGR